MSGTAQPGAYDEDYYKFNGQIIRIEIDSPYHETYKVDYLSYVRKTTSAINNNISLAQTGGGTPTGSDRRAG